MGALLIASDPYFNPDGSPFTAFLYDAMPEDMFDQIVAHPPYAPSLTESLVWRDGGRPGYSQLAKRARAPVT